METKYKYLIIGGGVAGVTAAETIRQKEPQAAIAVVNDEPYALYSRVMLSKPNFFLGKIPLEQVYIKNAKWYDDNSVVFLGGKTMQSIYPSDKTILLSEGTKIGYDKLLLATGVCARRWTVPGADKNGIHYLRTLDDGKGIMEAVKTKKRAVTIGGGFISFEMNDMLKLAGLEVTSIILEDYFWQPVLDEVSGKMVEKAMESVGVKILRKSEVEVVLGSDTVSGVRLKNGTQIECDMIVCGIGAHAQLDSLKNAGIKTNRGIVTNEYLETNITDIWAAGDVAEYRDVFLEGDFQMGNWASAHEQGRVAGLNMLGIKTQYKFVSFYTTVGFGVNVAFVGDSRMLPGRNSIPRGSPEINSYGRLIVDDKGELVGATLINRTKELSGIAKLIEQNVNVSARQKDLSNPEFDLKALLSQ